MLLQDQPHAAEHLRAATRLSPKPAPFPPSPQTQSQAIVKKITRRNLHLDIALQPAAVALAVPQYTQHQNPKPQNSPTTLINTVYCILGIKKKTPTQSQAILKTQQN